MYSFIPAKEWGLFPNGDGPLVVAGPCSAESRSQILDVAQQLQKRGVGVLRAGLWKPRTHPGGFEGVGTDGLQWLLQAREATGMKICTEVGSAGHAQACLKAGVDMVWIGARTTANPFQVQEICEALAGSGMPVLVKNPVGPDIELWTGAVERLLAAGINKIGAVLRGFTTLDNTPYRNAPVWEMLTRLRTIMPGLPVFADPSHMAGRTEYIKELSQRALDLGVEGLMVEVHPCPDEALSDAKQQLTPAEFSALMRQLKKRSASTGDAQYVMALEALRSNIDDVDARLLSLLSQRMECSRRIGALKKEHGISILQTGRWESLLKELLNQAESIGLEKSMVDKLFGIIHEYSVKVQS